MLSPTIERQILEAMEHLLPEQQQRVLSYARTLAPLLPPGVPGSALLEFAGSIPLDDLEAIAAAIDEGCEQVDQDEW